MRARCNADRAPSGSACKRRRVARIVRGMPSEHSIAVSARDHARRVRRLAALRLPGVRLLLRPER